jgi:hypothetical protein
MVKKICKVSIKGIPERFHQTSLYLEVKKAKNHKQILWSDKSEKSDTRVFDDKFEIVMTSRNSK